MPSYESTPHFEHGRPQQSGILVVNLGTPDAPTAPAVRRYLREFLSDPRVIEYPRPIWWLILNLVILRIRPRRTARLYQKIWTDQGSPLLIHSRQLASQLARRFEPVVVELAMTYGSPSISDGIDRLLGQNVRRIVVLPLYPQYSATTSAAVFDAVADKFRRLRWQPELRFVGSYHDDPNYVSAIANSIRRFRETNGSGDKLLFSFHGLPKYTLQRGDPYFCQCQKTARLVAEVLGLAADEWLLSFQSRVGREEWLQPYTDQTLTDLGTAGTASVDVVCPGFAADCLETLEEIAIQNAELFADAGGGELHYIPALNASDDHVDALEHLLRRHLHDWTETTPADPQSAQRAIALGAER